MPVISSQVVPRWRLQISYFIWSKLKDNQFTIIYDNEKQQILSFEKQGREIVCIFALKKMAEMIIWLSE